MNLNERSGDRHKSDLLVYSARLVRTVRRHVSYPATVRVLSQLDELGPQTVTALAHSYGCSQPTMTGLVHDLVAQGWASREPHPHDARSTLVAISESGLQALARVRGQAVELLSERLAVHPEITPADVRTAVAVLSAIVDGPGSTAADSS